MPEIAVIDVIVPAVPVIDVHSVGVAGPAGEPGPPGPAGPPGPPGEGAGPHQASHAAGGADQIVGPLALGANPAQTGALRLGLGIGPAITAPNSSLTGDLIALQVHTDNKIYIGSADTFPDAGLVLRTAADHIDATKPIALGVNPAQTGALRLANNAAITARNGANTADLDLVQTNAANNLVIGGAANGVFIDSAADLALRGHGQGAHSQLYLSAGGTHPGGDGVNRLGLPSARFYDAHLSTSVSVGDNPAQTGALRLANNQSIMARAPGNAADYHLLTLVNYDVTVGMEGLYLRLDGLCLLKEQTGVAPPANHAALWCEDNGAGKSRLMVQFATGAAIQLAIQP